MTSEDTQQVVDTTVPLFEIRERQEAFDWIREQFPYLVRPSSNPGLGDSILNWLDTVAGEENVKWTIVENELRFKFEDDYLAYTITWQKSLTF